MACSCDCPTVHKEIHYEKYENCPDTEFVIMKIKTMVPIKLNPMEKDASELTSIENRVQALETALQQTIWGANAVAKEQRQCYQIQQQRKLCEEKERMKRPQPQCASANTETAQSVVPRTTQRKQWDVEHTQSSSDSRGVLPNWANRPLVSLGIPSQMAHHNQPPATRTMLQRSATKPTCAPVRPAADTTVKTPWRHGGAPTMGLQSSFGPRLPQVWGPGPAAISRPVTNSAMPPSSFMRPHGHVQPPSCPRTGPRGLGKPSANSTMIPGLPHDTSLPANQMNNTLEDLVANFNNLEDSAFATVTTNSNEHRALADFNESIVSNKSKS